MGDTITLWRACWGWNKVELGSFQAEDKPKTYRVLLTQQQAGEITDWRVVIDKSEVGHKFFISPEAALQGFISDCQDKIGTCLEEIKRQQGRQAKAQARLDELLHD